MPTAGMPSQVGGVRVTQEASLSPSSCGLTEPAVAGALSLDPHLAIGVSRYC